MGCIIGMDAFTYGTHTMRRAKAILNYRRTKNLRAVQLLLGHTKPGCQKHSPSVCYMETVDALCDPPRRVRGHGVVVGTPYPYCSPTGLRK